MTDIFKPSVFIVDDSLFGSEQANISRLQGLIPNIEFVFCRDFIEVKHYYDQGRRPTALIVDCSGLTPGRSYDMGPQWAQINLIDMFDTYPAEQIPPTILIQSGDLDLAEQTTSALAKYIRSLDGQPEFAHLAHVHIAAMSKNEIGLAADFLDQQSVSADALRNCTTRNFMQFLSKALNVALPASPAEEAAYVLEKTPWITPDETLSMLLQMDTPLPDIIKNMRPLIKDALASQIQPRVDYSDSLSVSFMHASGVAAKGPAAFSVSEVDAFHAAGRTPIFFMRDYDPALLPQLVGKINGLVAPAAETPAHLAILMDSHNIAGLYGRHENNRETGDVQSGDIVTIEPHHNTLHLKDCKIYSVDERGFSWMPELADLIRTHLEQTGIHVPAIKMSVDHINSSCWASSYDGCGLIRTESFLFVDEDTRAVVRDAIMSPDENTLSTFGRVQEKLFERFLYGINLKNPVRVRLLDAKPEEFFSDDDIAVLKERHGESRLRGVQLADAIPGFYAAQTEALCRAYDNETSGYKDPKPLEIMVPTIKTVGEVVAAREMVQQAAVNAGLTKNEYRFGIMMETLEAGEAIEELVPYCNFISIGSNDYTSASLGCDRGDWETRHRLAIENGNLDPFTSMSHPKVLAELTSIVERARRVKPEIQIDLCGEHGAKALSLHNMAALRLNAVSVRPNFRNAVALPLEITLDAYDMARGSAHPAPAPAP